ERKDMSNKFDELTKGTAQSVTRRAALKKFGVGVAGMALACFGLPNKSRGATYTGYCQMQKVKIGYKGGADQWILTGYCLGVDPASGFCSTTRNSDCFADTSGAAHEASPCGGYWSKKAPCSFSY